ncbi:MAG TPA: type II toxin-antitoxin system HicB family antitoxin [Stellaceae bacterium]|jgi:antitoxin HicB
MYSVTIEPDDNGTFLVTCSDLPEVTTFGEDEEDAVRRAADAIEEALAARIARGEEIPASSRLAAQHTATMGSRRKVRLNLPTSNSSQRTVALPPLTTAKIELYRAARAAGMTKAELGRRLGWHAAQVDRLFDLRHRSQIEQIDQALRTMGKRLDVSVRDAA